MAKENKKCQNCQADFQIEPEDFKFYKKMKVPPPTFCSECRLMRRLTFRNERSLYKRKCDLCKKDMISIYHQKTSHPVYCQKCWWSDDWDRVGYGRHYDFDKLFFEQFRELMIKVPKVNLIKAGRNINSEYTNIVDGLKNCYLVVEAGADEDCMYSGYIEYSKNVLDSFKVWGCELSYELVHCIRCYQVRYAFGCENCLDSYFIRDCFNVQNCFGCVDLRNKQYFIFNKSYSKEEYFKKLAEFDLESFKAKEEFIKQHSDLTMGYPRKFADIRKSERVTGDFIINSSECYNCYGVGELQHGKDLVWCGPGKDLFDCYGAGYHCEVLYECQSVFQKMYNSKFCNFCFKEGMNIVYSDFCTGSSNLFGCVSLNKKQYCILNKQYTKDEYEELVPKIIDHMNDMPYTDKKGRVYKYGEFFPMELSPFAYNETIAQEYFPLTKDDVEKEGYTWKDPEERQYTITITADKLPDHIKNVSDSILNEIIGCQHKGKCNEQCTEAFKIIEPELEFYRKMKIPLPRLCPNCRHYQRIKQRNPFRLWHRKCQCAGIQSDPSNSSGQATVYKNAAEHSHHGKDHCPNEFETSYSPDRKEIIYCEKCYQQEVV